MGTLKFYRVHSIWYKGAAVYRFCHKKKMR
jgi:hypothetical protein